MSFRMTTRRPSIQDKVKMGNVRVCCRVRPQNSIETLKGGSICVQVTDTSIELTTLEGRNTFTYDHVFNSESSQIHVFEYVAKPVVQDVLDGYNATIFAYGQTSSGKTYTMEGPSITDSEMQGIIPRAAKALFEGVMAADVNIEFIVKVSYIEIYMERIRDLLDPYKTKVNLQVREDAKKGIYVAGVSEIYATSAEELLGIMKQGAENRAVAATGMNEGSSRSHSVFLVTLSQRDLTSQATKTGKLVLVDLAGSEMVRKTKASGQQLEEAKTINKSLSALGQVINALTDPNANHVPYRDSKLTRVLQESIGGNSRTALIINVSPSSYNAIETLSTLRFGSRAKNIKNMAVVNEQRSVEELTLLLQKAELNLDSQSKKISFLETQIQHYRGMESNNMEETTTRGTLNSGIDQEVVVEHGEGENKKEEKNNVVQEEESTLVKKDDQEKNFLGMNTTGNSSFPDMKLINVEDESKLGGNCRLSLESKLHEIQSISLNPSYPEVPSHEKLILKLQGEIASLAEELAEEKEEYSRQEKEAYSLQAILKQKDEVVDKLKEEVSQLHSQLLNSTEECKNIQIKHDTKEGYALQLDKVQFELQELKLHAETLYQENTRLKKEMEPLFEENNSPLKRFDSISDPKDDMKNNGTREPSETMSFVLNSNTNHTEITTTTTTIPSPLATSTETTLNTTSSTLAATSSTLDTPAMTPLDTSTSSPILNTLTLPPPLDTPISPILDTPAMTPLATSVMPVPFSMDTTTMDSDVVVNMDSNVVVNMDSNVVVNEKELDYKSLEAKYMQQNMEINEFKAKWELEKSQFLQDLSTKNEKVIQLEVILDKYRASETPPTTGSGISARERQHMRSVQQRLEQLVTVHRQLLRKYASLELENGEAKKKLVLREERISQLESNIRTIAGNMRTQADRHVVELTRLREQMEQQREEMISNGGFYKTVEPKPIRGRGDGIVRPIRGGGGGKQTNPINKDIQSTFHHTTSNTSSTANRNPGFLQRFFIWGNAATPTVDE